MSLQIKSTTCNHKWEEIFDSDQDKACYNDGFNYTPNFKLCTRCGKTERIKPGTMDYNFTFLVALLILLPVILPVIAILEVAIIVFGVYQDLFSKKNA